LEKTEAPVKIDRIERVIVWPARENADLLKPEGRGSRSEGEFNTGNRRYRRIKFFANGVKVQA
jgi:hypothetical protein